MEYFLVVWYVWWFTGTKIIPTFVYLKWWALLIFYFCVNIFLDCMPLCGFLKS